MSSNYYDTVRVSLGTFPGDVPQEVLAQWQSIIHVPIQVHQHPETGEKTYFVNDFPTGMSSLDYAGFLASEGIAETKSAHIMRGDRIRQGWESFVVVGPEVEVIQPLQP